MMNGELRSPEGGEQEERDEWDWRDAGLFVWLVVGPATPPGEPEEPASKLGNDLKARVYWRGLSVRLDG
jgi:hypothetical protein